MASAQSLRAEARRTGKTVYQVRLERARAEAIATGQPPPTAREALGHRRPGQPPPQAHITVYLAEPARASFVLVDIPTARRIGKHAELARLLAEASNYRGRPMTPARFRRLTSRWAPVTVLGGEEEPGRYRLLSDPDAAIVLLDVLRTTSVEPFRYRRGRR